MNNQTLSIILKIYLSKLRYKLKKLERKYNTQLQYGKIVRIGLYKPKKGMTVITPTHGIGIIRGVHKNFGDVGIEVEIREGYVKWYSKKLLKQYFVLNLKSKKLISLSHHFYHYVPIKDDIKIKYRITKHNTAYPIKKYFKKYKYVQIILLDKRGYMILKRLTQKGILP